MIFYFLVQPIKISRLERYSCRIKKTSEGKISSNIDDQNDLLSLRKTILIKA